MEFLIELTPEVDGRWIADIPALGILLYGSSQPEAIQKAQAAAREIIADKIHSGQLPAQAAEPKFAIAA